MKLCELSMPVHYIIALYRVSSSFDFEVSKLVKQRTPYTRYYDNSNLLQMGALFTLTTGA